MREPGALEVVRRRGIDPVVLAEEEAAEERLLRVRRAAAKRLLRSIPDPIDHRDRPRARASCQPQAIGGENLADAESPEVARLPWRRTLDHPAGDDLPADRKVRDRLVGLHRQATVGGLYPHGHLAVRPVGNRGHVAARRSPGANRPLERAAVDRSQPELAEPGTARHRGEGGKGDPRRRAPSRPRGDE